MKPLSPLQLRDYSLTLLHVEANPSFKEGPDQEYEAQLGVDFDFRKQKDAPVFRVDLDIALNASEKAFKSSPYRIQIRLEAFFEFDPGYPESDIPQLLAPNGLAMTYSIARGIVGQATGTSLHGKFVLPTVNFVELLKEKAKQSSKRGKK
jgi:preprotein translocase subunit SecB